MILTLLYLYAGLSIYFLVAKPDTQKYLQTLSLVLCLLLWPLALPVAALYKRK